MATDHIDTKNLTITGAHRDSDIASLAIESDVLIVVTKAFGPGGHNLVGISDVSYSGYPAVTIGVRIEGQEELVHLSPIHGDRRKTSSGDFRVGARCEFFCPVSKRPFDKVGPVDDGSGAEYYALYLTERLASGSMVMISDVWGHYHSRIVDDNELISYWASTHSDLI